MKHAASVRSEPGSNSQVKFLHPKRAKGTSRAVLCTNFGYPKRCTIKDRSLVHQKHPKTAACASLLNLSTMSKSKVEKQDRKTRNETRRRQRKAPTTTFRERGSRRPAKACQTITGLETHYMPAGQELQQDTTQKCPARRRESRLLSYLGDSLLFSEIRGHEIGDQDLTQNAPNARNWRL